MRKEITQHTEIDLTKVIIIDLPLIHWEDKGMYWAWMASHKAYEENGSFYFYRIPPAPTKKTLDYHTLYEGTRNEMKLCIGVWDNDKKYTPLHRDQLEWHINNHKRHMEKKDELDRS